jgi:hypothetical protein
LLEQTFDRIVHASSEELSLCPGLGDVKVRRLQEAFTSRFKPKRKDGPGKKTRDLPRSGVDDEDVSMTGVGEDSVGSPKRKKVDKGKGREMRVDDEKEGSPDWPSDEDEEESGGDGEGVDGEGKRKKNRVMEESDEEDDEDEERKRQERKRERAAQGRRGVRTGSQILTRLERGRWTLMKPEGGKRWKSRSLFSRESRVSAVSLTSRSFTR